MKKRKVFLIVAGVIIAIIIALILALSSYMSKIDHVLVTDASIENAILYTVDKSDELEFNVVYYGKVSNAVITDETGNGIDTLEELKAILGTADAPAEAFTTDPGVRTLGKAVTASLSIDAKGNIVTVTITGVADRPVVGISWKKDSIGNDYKRFANALERNGAIAVFLPQVTDAEMAREVLSAIDGIFFTGGEDWNPALYGQQQTPHGASGWNDARDASDIYLMQQAIAMDVPLLAVCRGAQGLNIAMGGALIQDVPYYLGQQVISGEISVDRVTKVSSGTLPGQTEGEKDSGYTYYDGNYQKVGKSTDVEGSGCEEGHLRVEVDGLKHGGSGYHELEPGVEGIGISADSKWLYQIFGADSINLIATAHHQAIDPDALGEGLTVVAIASDGIIEAIEYQDCLFALGLQWHPERDALSDTRFVDVDQDLSNAPLRELVKYAGINASNK